MPSTMQAMAVPALGPPSTLTLVTLPLPAPGPGQVRIKVVAASVNPAELKTISGETGLLHAKAFPMVTGWDYSGVVDALGAGVTALALGAEVFGFLPYSRRTRQGSFAQFVLASADQLAAKPAGVSHLQAAAAATVGITALQALRNAGLKAGQRVLVTGASGGVGALAIGIAQRLGASVDALSSKPHLEAVRGLGAQQVWDRQDPAWMAAAAGRYDVILDATGRLGYGRLRPLLTPGGRHVTTLPSLPFLVDLLSSRLRGQKAGMVICKSVPADLAQLAQWMEAGLAVPVAQTYPLAQLAEALTRLQAGDLFGKLAVQVA